MTPLEESHSLCSGEGKENAAGSASPCEMRKCEEVKKPSENKLRFLLLLLLLLLLLHLLLCLAVAQEGEL